MTPLTPAILVAFSLVMLCQHTVLHVEDRYGFPVLPLSAMMLAVYGEKAILSYRTLGYRKVLPLALYCIAACTVFVAQIIIWDNTTFY